MSLRWVSIYLSALGILNVLTTIVLAVVVGMAARGRGKVLGAVGFAVIAFSGLIGVLTGVIVNLTASNRGQTQLAFAVVNLLSTIGFLLGLVLVVMALLAASAGQRSNPTGSASGVPGPQGYAGPSVGPVG